MNGPLALEVPPDLVEAIAERAAAKVLEQLGSAERGSPWCDWLGAAEHLGCKPKRIRNLTSQGRIPHYREGGRVVYHKGELDSWVLDGRAAL